jgi:hypothetical protein
VSQLATRVFASPTTVGRPYEVDVLSLRAALAACSTTCAARCIGGELWARGRRGLVS